MSRGDDPYHDNKPYHMAHLMDQNGNVSPLCADLPRKINLKRECWTNRKEAVTCKKCLKRLEAQTNTPELSGPTKGGTP